MPPANQILFIGSSSFAMWKDVQNYFPSHPIINRGFGGSSLPDLIRYANHIIFPYQPKQILIYCGENDLAASDTITPSIVLDRFKQLFFLIRSGLPTVPVVYISIKPSPSRQYLMTKMLATNRRIKKYLKKKKRTSFVDVYHKMLDTDDMPLENIFLEDHLHMNATGYAIWQKTIEPYLLK
jgi:lysophospholipase L1-like esterase